MKSFNILTFATVGVAAPLQEATQAGVPEYYLIRHAEKNSDGTLSSKGLKRAQCLIQVFGKESQYNISHIMVQTPHAGSSSEAHRTQRPFNTTRPLAESLGIKIDTPCEYTDPSCAGREALKYTGPGNVLVAWEHVYLPKVADAIGARNAPKNPSDHFNYIYNLPTPYNEVTITFENCPGLD